MNIVDLIIIAVSIYCMLVGMYKGMIVSGLSLVGFAGAWFGAQAVYGSIANFALSNTTLMAVLNQYLEPESFFSDHAVAASAVSDVVAGGEAAISAAVASVGEKFSFIAEAFSANVRNQAFANLGISSMSDYFNQTLWVAVFNVATFIVAFIAIYIVISLIVNLLDHVISFPVMRSCDWLVGGIAGILRATVIVVLLLTVMPALTNVVNPEITKDLLSGSVLYTFASQLDLLNVTGWIRGLVMG